MARPKKFCTKKLNKQAIAYLQNEPYPTILDFALKVGITRRHIYELKTQDEEFSLTLEKITMTRENLLERQALTGQFNPTFAKFCLSQITGWKNEPEIHTKRMPTIIVQTVDEETSESLYPE